MKVALDTNRYVDFAGGDEQVLAVLEAADEILVPLIVLAELRAGFAVGARGARNEGSLRRFLMRPGVSVLSPDEQTTLHYANVYRQLRHQGTPIPTNDIWIAALVLQHGLVLCARDAHFSHLPQIPRV
jgi:tRNA(fMet)-specific endonuclease VapC